MYICQGLTQQMISRKISTFTKSFGVQPVCNSTSTVSSSGVSSHLLGGSGSWVNPSEVPTSGLMDLQWLHLIKTYYTPEIR